MKATNTTDIRPPDHLPLEKLQAIVGIDRVVAPDDPVVDLKIDEDCTLSITLSSGRLLTGDLREAYDMERGQRVSCDPIGTFFFVYVGLLNDNRLIIPCESKKEQELIWSFVIRHFRAIHVARSTGS